MRTREVTQEFRDRCKELAELSQIPEIKTKLSKLAEKYDRLLQEIEPTDASSIVPEANDQTQGSAN